MNCWSKWLFKTVESTSSTPTTMSITQPDGQISTHPLPSLATYEAHKVNFTWVVPSDQEIGIVPVSWQADPEGVNTADANERTIMLKSRCLLAAFQRLKSTILQRLPLKKFNLLQMVVLTPMVVKCLASFNIPYDEGSRNWAWETDPFSIMFGQLDMDR